MVDPFKTSIPLTAGDISQIQVVYGSMDLTLTYVNLHTLTSFDFQPAMPSAGCQLLALLEPIGSGAK